MTEPVPSRTAGRVARRRAAHQVLDRPLVFDDPLALRIAGIVESDILADIPREQHPLARALRAFLVARSRFTEDLIARAIGRGITQVVILGAGLDTFAYRHPYGDRLAVFEVDQPATQAWKRQRLDDAGIVIPRSTRYVPVDFERQTAFDGLATAGFDARVPAFFSWLGVTMYLSEATVMSGLGTIAALGRGTGIAFDYAIDPMMLTEASRKVIGILASRVAAAGEPWTLFFDPARLVGLLHALGFTHLDDLDGDAINARYFSRRDDGLRVGSAGRLVYAEV
jgi:methyltransferase (TIGR00027 family)